MVGGAVSEVVEGDLVVDFAGAFEEDLSCRMIAGREEDMR